MLRLEANDVIAERRKLRRRKPTDGKIAVYSQNRVKRMDTVFGLNVECLNVKPGGTQSNHWALKRWCDPKGRLNYTEQLIAQSV
jgi:hypothetical protein